MNRDLPGDSVARAAVIPPLASFPGRDLPAQQQLVDDQAKNNSLPPSLALSRARMQVLRQHFL